MLLFAALAALLLLWLARPGARTGTVAVVVLGDVSRSPRMCMHAASFAASGRRVSLVGYFESALPRALRAPRVVAVPLRAPPDLRHVARALFPLVAPLKVAVQTASLLAALITCRAEMVMVQTPPAIPTLAVARVAAAVTRSRLVIDWHNTAYTILALRLGAHPLVRLAKAIERVSGRAAYAHLFVTDAMRRTLVAEWGLRGHALVFRDRAPGSFGRTSAADAHALFERIAPELWGTQPFTHAGVWRSDRPALVVSSTSYTPDEDLGMLLDAADVYDAEAPDGLPALAIVVTGKGPMRAAYEADMRARARRWRRVSVATAWLAAEDYPLLLGAADVGVSLHASSSGLDLPMKVVDMLGCGAPVCALGFACLDELVVPGVNGEVFYDAQGLSRALQRVLSGTRCTASFVGDDAPTWEANWDRIVAPL